MQINYIIIDENMSVMCYVYVTYVICCHTCIYTYTHTNVHTHACKFANLQIFLLPLGGHAHLTEPGCLYTKQALWAVQAKLLEPGCTHTCTYTYMYIHMHTYMRTHTHMYIHMRAHTQWPPMKYPNSISTLLFPSNFWGTCPYFLSPLFISVLYLQCTYSKLCNSKFC